jgi:hypothetical protein
MRAQRMRRPASPTPTGPASVGAAAGPPSPPNVRAGAAPRPLLALQGVRPEQVISPPLADAAAGCHEMAGAEPWEVNPQRQSGLMACVEYF